MGLQGPQGCKTRISGILMIFVYVGVGLLFIFNIFNIDNRVISYIIGGLLCAYGIWRGVRLYKGWG